MHQDQDWRERRNGYLICKENFKWHYKMRYKHSEIKKISPIEPPCRKTIYNSMEEAQDIIRHINESRVVREIRAYKCSVCGFWHLTSKG
jgi:hypothetical protein